MQRTRSQVLYRYLPGSVFIHEDDFVARSVHTDMNNVESAVNKPALLEELSTQLARWPASRVAGIPRPGTVPESEFVLIEPSVIYWEVWPLLFACTSASCQRARKFFDSRQAVQAANSTLGMRCKACGSSLKQLGYYAAHACGRIVPMHMPKCKHCKSHDHVYLEDTGSFETASWRCRGCGNAYIQGTRWMPCRCGNEYTQAGQKVPFMRAFPVRDQRTWRPHSISLINLRDRVYESLQNHPQRGVATVASYIGDENRIIDALDELDSAAGGAERLTAEEWAKKEQNYRAAGLDEDEIAILRAKRAPLETGPAALRGLAPEVVTVGERRPMLERAVLFDGTIVSDRRTLAEAAGDELAQGRAGNAAALSDAHDRATQMGLDELAATLSFPILLATYGYTRTRPTPGQAHLHGFSVKNRYESKTPIFVSTASTEAIYVTVSARAVLDLLASRGEVAGVPANEREARLRILELFAAEDPAAETAGTLVHSLSHAMLRALDDGQTGFGESSLAEWVVPDALTFAIYVSSHQAYTLGALWTLLHTRARAWLDRAAASVWRCANDPLCHHRDPCACERCMFLTFGCRAFNADLSRRLLMDFWRRRQITVPVM